MHSSNEGDGHSGFLHIFGLILALETIVWPIVILVTILFFIVLTFYFASMASNLLSNSLFLHFNLSQVSCFVHVGQQDGMDAV